MSEDNLVLNKISPIHINKGRAVKAQFQLASQIVLAKRDPTGAGVKNSNKIYPIAIRAGATQIPRDKRNKSKINKPNAKPVAIYSTSNFIFENWRRIFYIRWVFIF